MFHVSSKDFNVKLMEQEEGWKKKPKVLHILIYILDLYEIHNHPEYLKSNKTTTVKGHCKMMWVWMRVGLHMEQQQQNLYSSCIQRTRKTAGTLRENGWWGESLLSPKIFTEEELF